MITSGPVLRPPPTPQLLHPQPHSPLLHASTSTDIQTQACRQIHTRAHIHMQRHIIIRTCWPVLLRRREMLSNSAFQHSTSDYLFSFTGRFELVMCFPFSVGLASLSLSLSFSLSLPLFITRSLSRSPSLSLKHTGNSSFPSARDPLGQKPRGHAFFHMSRYCAV